MTDPAAPGPSEEALLEVIWAQFRDAMFITPEEWRRITGIMTLHLTLDTYLFTILGLKLAAPMSDFAAFDRVNKYLGNLGFAARVDLAEALGWIGTEAAGNARAVNTVRNKLVHHRRGNRAKDAPEIATDEAFRAFVQRGLQAYTAMIQIVAPHFATAGPAPGGSPDS
jgi:hypothetical protein